MTARMDKYQWARMLLPLDLSGERWRVLYSVKEIHRDDVAKVSVTAIAQLTGLNRRTVNRHLRASESEGLIEVEWSKGGRAPHQIRLLNPTATTAVLRHTESRSKNEASEEPYCDSMGVAGTATHHACARISTFDLAEGGAPMGPLPSAQSSSTINVPSDMEELYGSAPDGASKAPGADAAIDHSEENAAVELPQVDALGSFASTSAPDPSDEADDEDEEPLAVRIARLDRDIADMLADGDRLPDDVVAFADRGYEPEADEVDRIERLIETMIDDRRDVDDGGAERERVERLCAERTRAAHAAQAGKPQPAPVPLSKRIHDEAARADFIERVAGYLVTLDRERRWHSARARQREIVEQLKVDLPRFRAEHLAEELFTDVLTEVWRRERGAALDAIVAVPLPQIQAAVTGSVAHG